ncbi:hypothetical protein CCU68_34555 [Pseudomonas gingeri NCPPB 3146 = LMG 5327]|uniref:DUF1534 domain-containing protein n=1 Tax=Pseudomonas gingeri NCPPB 3146 = LMG 5327 TaxID=707248 RepID=A0ABX4XYN9_9PSED|nr:hypothetical protein CCU68_34555 [Pseudomonas gingeri NCPPB 3146 = LMG 5327]
MRGKLQNFAKAAILASARQNCSIPCNARCNRRPAGPDSRTRLATSTEAAGSFHSSTAHSWDYSQASRAEHLTGTHRAPAKFKN